MSEWHELRDEMLEHRDFREAYDALGPRFEALRALIRARSREEVPQTELARRMNVPANVISRLESGAHSPRIDTIAEYARALGYDLKIRLVKRTMASPKPSRAAIRKTPARPSRTARGARAAASAQGRPATARRTAARTR